MTRFTPGGLQILVGVQGSRFGTIWSADMFPLLRHIAGTRRYELPPRPGARRGHRNTHAAALQERLGEGRRHVPDVGKFLMSIQFVPVARCGAVILLNEQAQQAMHALGQQPGRLSLLLVVAAVLWAFARRLVLRPRARRLRPRPGRW